MDTYSNLSKSYNIEYHNNIEVSVILSVTTH